MRALDSQQVHSLVTVGAQRDQILFRIASVMASELNVVNLEAMHATAGLAAPAVSLQNLTVQGAIVGRI